MDLKSSVAHLFYFTAIKQIILKKGDKPQQSTFPSLDVELCNMAKFMLIWIINK